MTITIGQIDRFPLDPFEPLPRLQVNKETGEVAYVLALSSDCVRVAWMSGDTAGCVETYGRGWFDDSRYWDACNIHAGNGNVFKGPPDTHPLAACKTQCAD